MTTPAICVNHSERSATMGKHKAMNPAWILIAVVGVIAAATLSACGGTGSTSTAVSATTSSTSSAKAGVPRIERAADGVYLARVEQGQAATPKIAAEEACKTMQPELVLQLKHLGVSSGSGIVLLQYGKGDPTERPTGNAAYALAAGDVAVVSPTLSLCGVGG
jgi:hypothetical protein